MNISVGKHFLKVVDEIPQIPEDIQSRFSNINPIRFFPYNELSRLNRAYMFLSEARGTHAIQSKVSNYIMCLECMFSTDAIEITHKVCERVAFFINDENHTKKAIFELIKSAYDVRSKYVHGQKLPSKTSTFNQLKELSEKMDDLIRRVFLKIIKTDTDVFSFGDTPLNEYYKDLILE
ncbi:hypothetical protein [Mucilaginibacter sp. NFX135]|uniref:hypothetical protein n=1 Tax=Mucilaginibacter sp. NFX135 TaxID=3402687 RepID=UPI003AFB7193